MPPSRHVPTTLLSNFRKVCTRGSVEMCGDSIPARRFVSGWPEPCCADPSILIVVEPGEHFDQPTQTLLDEALRLAAQDRTMIVIPSRLSTLIGVDRSIVLHEGKLEAEGSHTELYESSELYRHLNYVRYHAWQGSLEGSS